MGPRVYPNNIEVEVNAVPIAIRPAFNLIAGAGIALAGVDNPGADRVDVTVSTIAGSVRDIFIAATDYNSSNPSPYRSRNVGGTGAHDFTFYVPTDFQIANLVALELIYFNAGANVGVTVQIDFASEYCLNGQAKNFNFVNNPDPAGAVGSYLVGAVNVRSFFDLTNLAGTNMYPNLAAGHLCGLNINHRGIGGAINYEGIRLAYTV